jgi:hypothetical protein
MDQLGPFPVADAGHHPFHQEVGSFGDALLKEILGENVVNQQLHVRESAEQPQQQLVDVVAEIIPLVRHLTDATRRGAPGCVYREACMKSVT